MPHESFLINMAFRQAAGDELHRRELGSGLRWLFKDTHSLGALRVRPAEREHIGPRV